MMPHGQNLGYVRVSSADQTSHANSRASVTSTESSRTKPAVGHETMVRTSAIASATSAIPGLLPPGTFTEARYVGADQHRDVLRQVVDAVPPRFLWRGRYHSANRQTVQIGDTELTITGLGRDGSTYEKNIDVVDRSSFASPCPPLPWKADDEHRRP